MTNRSCNPNRLNVPNVRLFPSETRWPCRDAVRFCDRQQETNVTAIAANQNQIGLHIDVPRVIELSVMVRDPETVLELWRHEQGDDRTAFALSALRLGVLALRQASGFIDASTVRHE